MMKTSPNLNITQVMLPESKYWLKTSGRMTPRGAVFHNNGGSATAMQEIAYMIRNSNATSFHSANDSVRVVEAIPHNRVAHHAGNFPANQRYIGHEVCESTTDYYPKAEEIGIWYMASIFVKYNWPASELYLHRRFANTSCAHRISDARWPEIVARLANAIAVLKKEGVQEVFVPNPVFTPIRRGQQYLNSAFRSGLAVDGIVGPLTRYAAVVAWQRLVGTAPDAIWGPDTRRKTWGYMVSWDTEGKHVKLVQALLCLHGYDLVIDGDAGKATDTAIRSFQRAKGLTVDGIAGPETIKLLVWQ